MDGPASRRKCVLSIVFLGASRWPPQIVIRYPAMPMTADEMIAALKFCRVRRYFCGPFAAGMWDGPLEYRRTLQDSETCALQSTKTQVSEYRDLWHPRVLARTDAHRTITTCATRTVRHPILLRMNMPLFYRLTFLPEGRTEDFYEPCGTYYRLDDDNKIELQSQPVWCERCGTVTHGETIESVEQIDKKIANLERLAAEIRLSMTQPPLPALDAPGDRHQLEQISELQLRRKWRRERSSPPRCILCGSSQITPLDCDVPVRAGRGFVVLEFAGLYSGGFYTWYFTPEGERIAEAV